MGFSEVYLIGTDCTYSKNARHAQGIETAKSALKPNDDMEKFIIDYESMAEDIKEKNLDFRIYNCTRGGALEVFERKKELSRNTYPKVFKDMLDIEEGRPVEKNTIESQIALLKRHLDYIFDCKEEKPASDIMRGISVRYLKGFDNTKALRLALVQSHSKEDYLRNLDAFLNDKN